MNKQCEKVENKEQSKLSIKDFLSQDVENDGVQMMNKGKVIPFGVSLWP